MTITEQTRERTVPTPSAIANHDALIRLSVERLLLSSHHGSVRSMRMLVEEGVVMLFGTLDSYHVKQIVQTEVMKLEFVERIENHCQVRRAA